MSTRADHSGHHSHRTGLQSARGAGRVPSGARELDGAASRAHRRRRRFHRRHVAAERGHERAGPAPAPTTRGPAAPATAAAARARRDPVLRRCRRGRAPRTRSGVSSRVLAADPTSRPSSARTTRARAPGLVSQYRNLLHHFVHQQGDPEASTFWAGCGAVRRDAFDAVGGFDDGAFRRPSIEDIELGYRLRGGRATASASTAVSGTHLKRWTLRVACSAPTSLGARSVDAAHPGERGTSRRPEPRGDQRGARALVGTRGAVLAAGTVVGPPLLVGAALARAASWS